MPSEIKGSSNFDSDSAGKVLQVVHQNWTTQTQFTTNRAYVALTDSALSITTTQVNSKILVMLEFPVWSTLSGNYRKTAGLQRKVGVGSWTRVIGVDGEAGNAWADSAGHGNTISLHTLDDPTQSAGTLLTYEAMCGQWDSSTITINYTGYSLQGRVTLMEIGA